MHVILKDVYDVNTLECIPIKMRFLHFMSEKKNVLGITLSLFFYKGASKEKIVLLWPEQVEHVSLKMCIIVFLTMVLSFFLTYT